MEEFFNLNNEIVIYRSEDGKTRLDVKLEGDTVWLSQQQMSVQNLHIPRITVVEKDLHKKQQQRCTILMLSFLWVTASRVNEG